MYIPDTTPTQQIAVSRPSLTTARAMQLVQEWTDLAPRRRAELVSGLSTFSRIAGIPPESLTLSVPTVRQALLNRPGAVFGVSEGRMRNLRCDIRAVLRLLELIDPPLPPLMAEWEALLDLLAFRQRPALIGFARYCSGCGVHPASVDVATLRAFLTYLEERTTAPRPRKLVGAVHGTWNRSVARIPAWPTGKLPALCESRSYVLPLENFPDTFQEDLAAFGRRLAGGLFADDAFADDEPTDGDDAAPLMTQKPLRPTTIATRLGHVRWAASALVASGCPVGDITSLASLVIPLERPKEILRHLYRRAGDQPSAAGMHVAETLRIIAKYHARRPDNEVAKIRDWGRTVRLTYQGMTLKNQRCVREAMDPAREHRLRALPNTLMQAARTMLPESPREAAALAWRAVAIEILTKRPIRLGNLRNLRLDRHLHQSDPRKTTITAILIQRNETKNEQPLSLPVPRRTAALLSEWLTTFRPIVASPDCMYLFPGQGTGNQPLTPQALRDAVRSVTGRYAGVTLTPHQFRHFAAHVFLEEHPGEYELVRQLLGHASVVTTVRHYAGHQTEAAARRFDEVILNRPTRPQRNSGAPSPRGKPHTRRRTTSCELTAPRSPFGNPSGRP